MWLKGVVEIQQNKLQKRLTGVPKGAIINT
jgi:hypothetical protein